MTGSSRFTGRSSGDSTGDSARDSTGGATGAPTGAARPGKGRAKRIGAPPAKSAVRTPVEAAVPAVPVEELPEGDGQSLTERQQRVLSFIDGEIKRNGYPPTIREIGRHLGIKSTNGVNDHLNALQRKGFIRRQDHKSRTLTVVSDPHDDGTSSRAVRAPPLSDIDGFLTAANDELVDVPLLGRVAAGLPILAEEQREDTVRVSSFFLGRGNRTEKVFALRVVGESMIDDGIYDGDFLFVKKQSTARTGEIVVAMIEGEATVKRFFPEGERIRFQPANARMEPIFVEKRAFRQTDILGIVVGVYRKM